MSLKWYFAEVETRSRDASGFASDRVIRPWQERRMGPLFLILGVLAWGYPEEALHVFGFYVGALMLKARHRSRWPLRHRYR